MKTQFKILMLMLIISAMSYGQRHQVLKKSVEVNKNTSVVLNFENIYVAIEESTDGKIHFDYALEFEGYSKQAIQKKLDEISAEVSNSDDHVTLKVKSLSQVTFRSFTLTSNHGLYIDDDIFVKKNDTVIRKTKDSLLREIKINNRTKWSKNPLEYINKKFKKMDKEGNLSEIRKGNVDIMVSQFVIKIPPFVKLNINAKNSGVHFRNDLQNELSILAKQGTLKAKLLSNTYNVVRVDNANFEAEAISGGTYDFKNVKNGKIGSTKQVKIDSEFSKIEIGEIGNNNTITDFNSEYWLYNWSGSFNRFNLYSEYSKIHFFYPILDFSLKVVGNNTKSFLGNDVVINMQPNSKGEKFTMMTNDPEDINKVSGDIYIDIIHGIIYSNDFLLTKVTGDQSLEETINKN